MNSPLGYELARAHVAELHRTAARTSAPRASRVTAPSAPPLRTRQRAGWWLVAVGLRLATGPATVR